MPIEIGQDFNDCAQDPHPREDVAGPDAVLWVAPVLEDDPYAVEPIKLKGIAV